jgi:hypothetical protein
MTAITLNQLNLLTLPAIDVLKGGWGAVVRLPEETGCYSVIATVGQKKVLPTMSRHDAAQHSRALIWALQKDNAASVAAVVNKGSHAALNLYVGHSKNLLRRWASSNPHHKEADLRAVAYLLGLFFEIKSLKIHYLLTRDADSAKFVESGLIKLWKPVLNNRAPLVNLSPEY